MDKLLSFENMSYSYDSKNNILDNLFKSLPLYLISPLFGK